MVLLIYLGASKQGEVTHKSLKREYRSLRRGALIDRIIKVLFLVFFLIYGCFVFIPDLVELVKVHTEIQLESQQPYIIRGYRDYYCSIEAGFLNSGSSTSSFNFTIALNMTGNRTYQHIYIEEIQPSSNKTIMPEDLDFVLFSWNYSIEPNEFLQIRVRIKIRIYEISYTLSGLSNITIPHSVKKYVKSTKSYPSDDAMVKELAYNITKNSTDFVKKAYLLFNWVVRNIKYDATLVTAPSEITRNVTWILEHRRAICEGFAYLYATLCRAVGIPARVIYGLIADEGSPHAWVELFLNGLWVPCDPTFGWFMEYKKADHIALYVPAYYLNDPNPLIRVKNDVEWIPSPRTRPWLPVDIYIVDEELAGLPILERQKTALIGYLYRDLLILLLLAALMILLFRPLKMTLPSDKTSRMSFTSIIGCSRCM